MKSADYADERIAQVVDAVLLNLFLFLELCMNMTKGNDREVGYLFAQDERKPRAKKEAGKATPAASGQDQKNQEQNGRQRDQFEKDLQMHCYRFLRAGGLNAKVEVSDVTGGRADIQVTAGKVELVIEVKREDQDATFPALQAAYAAQATEYSNTNARIGFLLVLDRTRTDGTAGDIQEKVKVTTVTKAGDTVPRTLVMISVPAKRKRPSELKLPTKAPAGAAAEQPAA
jgi:hypothetical protein